jgi:hypothetical protein
MGKAIAVEIPNGSLVSIECAQTLAIFGPPYRGNVIFGGGKQEVAIVVVLDNRNGSLVAFEKNRSLKKKRGRGGV